jgi:TolB-like protein/tetratricopeptide (TPR) repeat protein
MLIPSTIPTDTMRNKFSKKMITIAVIPFENLSLNGEYNIFCSSFCMDLITELSRFRQFQIIAFQSAQQLQIKKKDDLNTLDSDYFIQGSFRADNNIIRINAQLGDSRTQRLVWANRFEAGAHDILQLQDDLLLEITGSLQEQLNYDLISRIHTKTDLDPKAYECWLYGMEELKNGSPYHDEQARSYFQHAIEIDPAFSLAYSGMSLTYFNEWSCQLWERWEVSQNGAFKWAEKAIEMDEQNYIAAVVLGRIFLFRDSFGTAEYYIRRSLQLNHNDPFTLIQAASCLVYLGYAAEAEKLYKKTLRINPVNTGYYHQAGVFILNELGKYDEARALVEQIPEFTWIDSPVFIACTYFYLKDFDKMHFYWTQFVDDYNKRIHPTKTGTEEDALEWFLKVNPFKGKSVLHPFISTISSKKIPVVLSEATTGSTGNLDNLFEKKGEVWSMIFEGDERIVPGVKGFYDLQRLLQNHGSAVHCAELMDNAFYDEGVPAIDEISKKQYQAKILSLQEDLTEAENVQDYQRYAKIQEEYDTLLKHVSASLGLQGKTRKAGGNIEKARSAVTWRIRHAISKIEKEHPRLGSHLSYSIRTGTFCSYAPEQETSWNV